MIGTHSQFQYNSVHFGDEGAQFLSLYGFHPSLQPKKSFWGNLSSVSLPLWISPQLTTQEAILGRLVLILPSNSVVEMFPYRLRVLVSSQRRRCRV